MAIKKGLGRGLDDLIPTKGGRTRSSETDNKKDNSEKSKTTTRKTTTKKTRTAAKKKEKEPGEDVPKRKRLSVERHKGAPVEGRLAHEGSQDLRRGRLSRLQNL